MSEWVSIRRKGDAMTAKAYRYIAYSFLMVALLAVASILTINRKPFDPEWKEWRIEKPEDSLEVVARYADGKELDGVAIYSRLFETSAGIHVMIKLDNGLAEYRGDPVKWHYKK
jgi:hypothetical protein